MLSLVMAVGSILGGSDLIRFALTPQLQNQTSTPTPSILPRDPLQENLAEVFQENEDQYVGSSSSGKLKTIEIIYCAASNYNSQYQQLKKELQQRRPSYLVEGKQYPVPQDKSSLVNIMFYVLITVGVAINFGDKIPQLASIPLFKYLIEKKFIAVFLLMMLYNTLKSSLLSSGAFEIYVNGEIVFSKLQQGRMPNPEDLIALL